MQVYNHPAAPTKIPRDAVSGLGGSDAGSNRGHVSQLLVVMHCVVNGLSLASQKSAVAQVDQLNVVRQLVVDILLPLHEPNEMVLWRDQIPVIQSYHEILVKCLVAVIKKEEDYCRSIARPVGSDAPPTLLETAITFLLEHWPDGFSTNTPKQVLFLHELELLLRRFVVGRPSKEGGENRSGELSEFPTSEQTHSIVPFYRGAASCVRPKVLVR